MGAPTTSNLSIGGSLLQGNTSHVVKESLETTYTNLIQEYLQVMCLENATFLAERMVAAYKTTNAHYLLAICHYRSGRPQRAMMILEDVKQTSPASQYLVAKCCYDLELFGRAEEALLQASREEYKHVKSTTSSAPPMEDWLLETSPCPIPNGAAGLFLLGNVCRKSARKQRAIQYYKMSLQLDPLMWTSYEALCELGATDIDPTSTFGVRPAEIDQFQEAVSKPQTTMPLQEKTLLSPSFAFSPLEPTRMAPVQPMDIGTPSPVAASIPKTSLFQTAQKPPGVTPNQLHFETPNLTPIPHHQDASFLDVHNPQTVRRAKHVAARLYYQPSPETPDESRFNTSRYLRGRSALFGDPSGISETPLRRGGRASDVSTTRRPRTLFHSENKVNNTKFDQSTTETHANMLTEQNPLEHHTLVSPKPREEDPSMEKESSMSHNVVTEEAVLERHQAVQKILELFCVLGAGYWRLNQYRCRDALQLFQSLPATQQNTGWVLHQVGRSYFEMSDYKNSQRSLELMQRVEPYRMKGLELLSTVLWQRKEEVELAHLAQRAVEFDRLSPEAWCVVGNCFSLQKEHETALVYFRRSLQLDPGFTYTHTLSGYEYMANEDFDKALACFRNAIRSDERHYNAWYGMGAIYHRQEKYDFAEYHFHRAVSINPQSSVLRCNLGMSQYSNGKSHLALDTLAEASRLDPSNPQARFQRATIYVALNRQEEALKELEKVRDAAPRESAVHFSMGKVLKRLGRPDQAMRCFLTALDLDPKDNQLIKSAMDKVDEPDMDEEVAAF